MELDFINFKNTKDGKIILGQIISVLNNVYFVENSREKNSFQKLMDAGFEERHSFAIPPYFNLGCSIGLKSQAVKAIDVISEKAISSFTQLSNGDKNSFSETIKDIIRANISNKELFDFEVLFSDKTKSLFELSSPEIPNELALSLWQLIYEALDKSINEWIVIYPLHKISCQSFSLNHDGIFIVNPPDEDAWQTLASEFDMATRWYFSDDKTYDWILKREETPWLICKVLGTADGAKYAASKFMRTFVAVLFSHLYPLQVSILSKVIKEPETYSVQFASKNKQTKEDGSASSIGVLLPSSGENIIITDSVLQDISNWYEKRDSFNIEQKGRLNTASQFIHYGIVANGLERFIHFFISLDSMFGERHKVETKITEGVINTFPEEYLWNYKIKRLFDLRSELVHGGCSSISEWKELDAYQKHTNNHPTSDVIRAAMTAFKNI